MGPFLEAVVTIAGIIAVAFVVTAMLEGGTGFSSDGPKAPPPRKAPPGVS